MKDNLEIDVPYYIKGFRIVYDEDNECLRVFSINHRIKILPNTDTSFSVKHEIFKRRKKDEKSN